MQPFALHHHGRVVLLAAARERERNRIVPVAVAEDSRVEVVRVQLMNDLHRTTWRDDISGGQDERRCRVETEKITRRGIRICQEPSSVSPRATIRHCRVVVRRSRRVSIIDPETRVDHGPETSGRKYWPEAHQIDRALVREDHVPARLLHPDIQVVRPGMGSGRQTTEDSDAHRAQSRREDK